MASPAPVQPKLTSPSAAAGVSRWVPGLWIGLLLLAGYGPSLAMMAGTWFDETADMGHGVLVPFAVAYLVWERRAQLALLPVQPTAWGLALVAWSVGQIILCNLVGWRFLSQAAFLQATAGCILYLRGWATLRALAYPFLVLCLMVPPPNFVFERVTMPLQLLASRLAEFSLDALGYSVLREGNILEMVGERLSVAEACSGIRSIITLEFFLVLYAYLFATKPLARSLLILAGVPIAILGNAGRIVFTGVVGQYDRALAHGVLHDISGFVTVSIAGLCCVGLHQLALRYSGSKRVQHG